MDGPFDVAALLNNLVPMVSDRLLGRGVDGFDVDRLIMLAAGIDSANFAATCMNNVTRYGNAFQLLSQAIARANPDGLFLEFGVASGTTINHMAGQLAGKIYGFDGFEGLPEDWRPGFPTGAFAQTPPAVAANVELVIGWFNQSLPRFLDTHTGPVSFMHVDCDLYSSTKTIFDLLGPRIRSGTVIVFDEFFNYPGWRIHEFKAFMEFVGSYGLKYEYFGMVPSHQQVGVIIK
ncbi:MAG: hypothetical protein B7Z78_05610 [Rhodospirillales bacterium 20-60-12]|nr:MAG: hypothetical protein B7Z78_05610 [Rhodospirillales bacterium 20-60-12]HQT68520.1 class I SAM-dependent methyltransferase [Acetobacteraceae bacterium]